MLAALSLTCLGAQAAPLRDWPVVNRDAPAANVRAVQYLLGAHGCPVMPDGVFGRATEKALQKFQRASRLVATGQTNDPTWEALIMPLHAGSRGPAVKAAQIELRNEGYAVAVDGAFRSQMKGVTKTFQARTGHTADGVIGRNTWYELVGGSPDAGND